MGETSIWPALIKEWEEGATKVHLARKYKVTPERIRLRLAHEDRKRRLRGYKGEVGVLLTAEVRAANVHKPSRLT